MPTLTVYPDATLSGVFQQTEPTSTEATLHEALDAEDNATYVDFLDPVFTSGNCYEVVELDLSSLPAGAVVTSVTVEFRHQRNRAGGMKVTSCAIDGSGDIVEGVAESASYGNWNVFHDVVRPTRYELKDGGLWSSYSRLGLIMQHVNAFSSDTGFHRVYYARAVIEYDVDAAPTVVATGPSGNIAEMAATTWTYSHGDGRVQTHYRVKVTDGAATDPDVVSASIDSGKIQSTNGRSYDAGLPLAAGDYKAWVKVWSTSSSDEPTESDWDDVAFTIDVPAEPAVAPDQVVAEYFPDEARVEVEVIPELYGGSAEYAIERSAGGSEFSQVGTVDLGSREANLLRFDAGALAYVSTPQALSAGQYGVEFAGRIRNVDGQNQPVLYALPEGVDAEQVARGAAVAARADSFYDTRYRDGSGDMPCRNGSGRLATVEGGVLSLGHDGVNWAYIPGGGLNLVRMNTYFMDGTATVVTLKARVRYRGDSSQSVPLGAVSQRAGLRLLNSGAIYGHIRATTNTHFPGLSADRTSPSVIAGLVAGDIVDIEVELDLAGGQLVFRYAVNAGGDPEDVTLAVLDTVSVDPDTLGSVMVGTDFLIGKTTIGSTIITDSEIFYAGVFPNVGNSLEFHPDRDAIASDGNVFTDATSGEEWTFEHELTGYKSALVTSPVDLFDEVDSSWLLDAADTPTFTESSGRECRVVMFSSPAIADASAIVYQASSETNDDGAMLFLNVAGALTLQIDGAGEFSNANSNLNVYGVGPVLGASHVDNGTAQLFDSVNDGFDPTSIDMDGYGPFSHAVPRIGRRSGSATLPFGGEAFASLNFLTGDLPDEDDLRDLSAFLKSDRRISPAAPTTFLALREDGRVEASIETAAGVKVGRSVDPIPGLSDGDLVWIRATYYPSVGAWIIWYSLDQAHAYDDVVWLAAADDSPDGAEDLVTASIDLPLAIGPASDPAGDLDVFHVSVSQSGGSHDPVSLNVERDLDAPAEATELISGEGTWTLSEPYDPLVLAGQPIVPVLSESTAIFQDYPPLSQTLVYRARTLAVGGPPSDYVNSAAVESPITRWWLLDPEDPDLNYVPDVVDVQRSEARSSVVTRMRGRVVAATSGGLGNLFSVTIRTSSAEERVALEALLNSGRSFRMVDVLGREWTVAVSEAITFDWVRAMPVGGGSGLRDFHMITVPMVEVI